MRYLFQYVYKLGDLDDISPEATSRDLGRFIHNILNLFINKLVEMKTNIHNLGIDRAAALASQIIEEYMKNKSVLERIDFAEFHKLELFSGLERESVPDIREGVFASLMQFEYLEFMNRIPEGVEVEFGTRDMPVRLGNVSVRGYIDRFDSDINFPKTVYLYDYKTGFIKPSSNIKKGLAFQLPVYIRALQSIDRADKIFANFYSLKRSAFLENAPLKNPVINNASGSGLDISGVTLIDEFTDHLAGLVEKGMFHHTADGDICDYCEFKFACHKNPVRMDHLLESCPDLDIYSGRRNLVKWQEVDNFRKEWKKICQSMEKAETLKTDSARKKHYETVLEFKNDLTENRDSLPFTAEYLGTLLEELDRFELRYNSYSGSISFKGR